MEGDTENGVTQATRSSRKEASNSCRVDPVTAGTHEENDNLFTTSILQKVLDVKTSEFHCQMT